MYQCNSIEIKMRKSSQLVSRRTFGRLVEARLPELRNVRDATNNNVGTSESMKDANVFYCTLTTKKLCNELVATTSEITLATNKLCNGCTTYYLWILYIYIVKRIRCISVVKKLFRCFATGQIQLKTGCCNVSETLPQPICCLYTSATGVADWFRNGCGTSNCYLGSVKNEELYHIKNS